VHACHVCCAALFPLRYRSWTATCIALHRPCSYYKEELNEDVKAALAGALGAWLPRCAGMPDAALARLTGARVCVCQVLACIACAADVFAACQGHGCVRSSVNIL
jgi:hypothetical protein